MVVLVRGVGVGVKDKMGVEGWRVEENVVDGKKYGGEIVGEIKDVVDDIEEGGDLLGFFSPL